MRKFIYFICILLNTFISYSQYSIKKFNWSDAGFKGTKPTFAYTVNILSYGGDNTNTNSNNNAFNNALTALAGKGGVIYFPKGVYKFTASVNINRDSIIIKGAGYDSTELRFNLSGLLNNCINITGSMLTSDSTKFTNAACRDSSNVNVASSTLFNINDWVYLQCNDAAYMASSWAYKTLGQILKIKNKVGNKLYFNSPFRFYYKTSLSPKITKIIPRKAVGIECLKISRKDATTGQTSNINFDKAVQCWVNGIESDSTNYAHIELNRSSNIDIINSYFRDAFAYGGSGQGYGIALQYSSNECKIENNIFNHLRHSVLLQAGANGNAIGYNYSKNPFWTEPFLPSNSAGDLVLHGNYPFSNLFEGNINQNTVIDNSHGLNGPYNTFLRNRSELYGIFMNNSPATDSTQFLGLEITNTTTGLYNLVGNGNLEYGNNNKGVLTPVGTTNLKDTSLYYFSINRPNCFNTGFYNWPIIGLPNVYNTGTNAAKQRSLTNKMAICNCGNSIVSNIKLGDPIEITAYPIPVVDILHIKLPDDNYILKLFNVEGKQIDTIKVSGSYDLNLSALTNGIYFIKVFKENNPIGNLKFIKLD